MQSFEDIYYDEEPGQAYRLLLVHAEAGNAEAQFYVGHLCDESSPRRQAEAVEWYRRSSQGGFLEATHWFASHLYFGMGVAQDVPRALSLFRNCAEAGLDASQWKLGQHLLGIEGALEEALMWLRRAAEQGHTGATELLQTSEGGFGV
jgi:TPR repeat protein